MKKKITAKGPIGKFLVIKRSLKEIIKICNAAEGDSLFLSCGKENDVKKFFMH